jgi:hypothetical protein
LTIQISITHKFLNDLAASLRAAKTAGTHAANEHNTKAITAITTCSDTL